ncbi:MAG: type 1 glutamine amidotransferase domain-containing protein [Burkholderiaceae bacterium]
MSNPLSHEFEYDLQGYKVAILVDDFFEQAELEEPLKALKNAGAQTFVISPKGPTLTGMKHHDKGDSFPVDVPLDHADPSDYDALVLPGGVVNADALRIDQAAQQFARAMDRANKPLAVICHGAWLLISAGLVKDRTLTSWPTLKDDLVNAGAKWVDKEVVSDRHWTSSRKPADLPAFNKTFMETLTSIAPMWATRPRAGQPVSNH